MKFSGSSNRSLFRSAQFLMLAQSAVESEEELRQESVFAKWHDGESEKSARRRRRVNRLED